MTAGDWLLGSLLILGFCLWLLAAAKRNSVLRLCGVALRPLARIFRRVESRPVNCTALIERNQDIIAKYLNAVTTFFSDSAPTQAKFCIAEISRREGKGHLAPGNEHIWQWEERHNIPAEYRQLKNHILGLFERRYSELWRQREQIAQTAAQVENDLPRQIRSPQQELISRNQDLIDKFLDITERKVSVLDDYGDEHWDVLPDEVRICLKKIVQREGLIEKWNEAERWARSYRRRDRLRPGRAYGKEAEFRSLLNQLPEHYRELDKTLTGLFRQYHEHLRTQFGVQTDLDSLSGPEFETHVAKLLTSAGYDVMGTPQTGDQGADLIAKKDGKKIVVQAKRYQGPVGNKAVQEVFSAMSFYGGDEGWVVTNSTFTPSAKALAQKAGIRLIDGKALETEADF
jgi:hypothetical protein